MMDRYTKALENQPSWAALDHELVRIVAGALFGVGSVSVLSSMYALGVTGTYLGDYFVSFL